MNNKLIRLTESDLHRIVKESVRKVINEYTNGYTERLYKSLRPTDADSAYTVARKRGALDYLRKRWERENGYNDDQVQALDISSMYSVPRKEKIEWLEKANLTPNQLRHFDRNITSDREGTKGIMAHDQKRKFYQ